MNRRLLIAAILSTISAWGITALADGHFQLVEGFGLLGLLGNLLAGPKPRPRRRRRVNLTERLNVPPQG